MTEATSTTPADKPGQADKAAVKPVAASPAAAVKQDRVAELEAENARLREQLVAAGQAVEAGKPHEPSFTFSAGQADELERLGRTQSPFTGKLYVGTSTANAREATSAEFAAAKPPQVNTTGPAKAAAKTAARGGRAK